MKILYIIDTYRNPYAGTEGQLYKLIDNMDRARYEPHLLLLNSSDYIKKNGFPCDTSVVGYSKLSSPSTWYHLYRHLKAKRSEGFLLAHVFFNDPSIIAPPLLRLLGYKTLISRRDMGYWYTSVRLSLLRLNSFFIDGVIVNSEAVKAITHQKERISLNKIHVIYNGYDVEITKSINSAAAIDKKINNEIVNIGIVANIRPIKRMEDAIRAIGLFVKQTTKVKLTIVGDGSPEKLITLAKSLDCEGSVDFVGAQSNVKSFIKNFDIAILCSESEGFSNAIIEYMQEGKPVVCSNVGGNPEIIISGENGYLYEVGDVDGLVDKLSLLIESSEVRNELGLNGQCKVLQEYSIDRMLNEHYSIYGALL